MDPFANDEPGSGRWIRWLAFIGSALLAAGALRFAWFEPILAAILLGAALLLFAFRMLSRRRLRKVLQSGDVSSVLERWSPSFHRIPHAETMAPLMTATAFAAYGWVEKARAALAAAKRGPAWEAAIEHRLFLDALLLTFEGDRDGALDRAGRLERLPLPDSAGSALRDRIQMLRKAVAALARAFAHQSLPGDQQLLETASETSPLVFWAMRYAAAVVAVDRGDLTKVRQLLTGAPNWPKESTFRAFHDEIADRAGISTAA
ncbi:MAG TPA: hypothetical protein VK459_03735 [Polyangiaceae bacterium]|nr:hypothetical protein [Polyangiaceae bacterium]